MTASPQPPRWLERLLFFPARPTGELLFALGDLREEYAERRRAGARTGALLWFAWQVLAVRFRLARDGRPGRREATLPLPHSKHSGSAMLLDIVQAARTVRRRPRFAGLVALTMASGVAATVVMVAALRSIVFTPLPWPEPERVQIVETRISGLDWLGSSLPEYQDLSTGLTSFTDLAGYGFTVGLVGDSLSATRLNGLLVTGNLFSLLGATPALGRVFAADEARPGAAPVVLLSHRTWQRDFGADPEIVGRAVQLDGRPTTVVGVMQPGFAFPDRATEIWEPWRLDMANPAASRSNHFLRVIGRIRPGVEPAEAAAELAVVTARIGQAHPDTYALGYETRLRPFVDLVLGGARQHLRLLTLAALLLLAIGTVNVGMLAASRREARTHESSVRAALGSGSVRALVPFAVETWTGIIGGALAGTWIGWAVLRWVRSLDPAGVPRVDLMGLSGGTLLIVGLAVLLAGGVTTALAMMGVSIPNPLRTGARGTRNTPAAGRRARILVVTQVALAMTLCTGAALMVRSVRALYAVDPGVRAEGVLTARVTPRGARYRDPAARIEFHRQVREALLAAPGVRAAGASLNLPYAGRFDGDWTFQTEADQDLGIGESPVATVQMVSPGYFEAVGLRVAGRTFSERDGAMDPAVAIVNETMARRHWPGRSAIGQRIRVWNDPVKPWMEIVAVVADVRALGLDQAPTPIYYLPTTQSHVSTYFTPGEMFLSVAGDRDPELLVSVVHRAVAEVDPTAIVSSVQSLGSVIDAAVGPRSLTLWILAAFGGVALLLASIGIMASMIATVTARRSEIGIRRAFGARPVPVAARLLGQSLSTVLVGAGIGGVLAIAATRAISPLLFGVEAWDPVAIGGAALVLSLAAIAASLGPTITALRVEPLESLRSEN